MSAESSAPLSRRWSLHGKRIVVTGGSKGIGKAIVEEIAGLGGSVLTCARSDDTLQACLLEWRGLGYDVEGCVADVSTEEGRQCLLDAIQAKWTAGDGCAIDGLVNNVGTNIRKRAVDYTEEEYDHIMQTNLRSSFLLTQKMHALLRKGDGGSSVVNIGSVAGGCGTAMRSGVVYGMTKAALAQMTFNLACEWAAEGIRVNAIAPWYIDTPLVQPVLQDPASLAYIKERTPMKRVGTAQEVSGLAAFLLMESSTYVTGQVIAADGGFLRNGFY